MSSPTVAITKFVGTISLGLLTVRPPLPHKLPPPFPPFCSHPYLTHKQKEKKKLTPPIPNSAGPLLYALDNNPSPPAPAPNRHPGSLHIPALARSHPTTPGPAFDPQRLLPTPRLRAIPIPCSAPVPAVGHAGHRVRLWARRARAVDWRGRRRPGGRGGDGEWGVGFGRGGGWGGGAGRG